MKFLQRLLRQRDAVPPRKQEPLDEPSAQFCAWKGRVTMAVAEGLSDPSQEERRATADVLRSDFLTAVEDDPDAGTRARTARTLERLARELRPPKNEEELTNLDNAAFYYCKRLLLRASSPADAYHRPI